MKQLSKKYSLISLLLLVTACDIPHPEYVDSGNPERLLDVSYETVTVSMAKKNAVTNFSKIISESKPSKAEIRCSLNNTRCAQAKEILERNSVVINLSHEQSNSILLSYKKAIVRDCNSRYVDDTEVRTTYNHPAFGCAVSANIVNMVSNKQQFTEPNLLDFPDAEKANQSYNSYLKPSSKREVKDAKWDTQSGSN